MKDKNIGILITDHNVDETLSITDGAYLLFEGKILFQRELRRNLVDNFARKNTLDATLS